MITTFHLSGPDLAATNNELYWQTLAEHNYSTGTMVNQLIRVFLKFNFMALQHQAKWSLMLLWVNELYPLCLQLLNSLVKIIKCYTYNLSQGPSFAMGCSSPWSAENASALTGLKPGLAAPFSGCWAPLSGTHQANEQIHALHGSSKPLLQGGQKRAKPELRAFHQYLNHKQDTALLPDTGVTQSSRQRARLGLRWKFSL